jgi:hypothetical protein
MHAHVLPVHEQTLLLFWQFSHRIPRAPVSAGFMAMNDRGWPPRRSRWPRSDDLWSIDGCRLPRPYASRASCSILSAP